MTEILLAQGMSPLCPVVGFMFILFTCVIVVAVKASNVRNKRGRDASVGQWQCGHGGCHAWNPGHARFCRMCGTQRGAM